MMKKLLSILFIFPLFFACSSDKEETQDYTSFVFISESITEFKDCIIGYKLEDNTYKKLADLGTISEANPQSKEIKVADTSIKEVYFFSYIHRTTTRIDKVFILETNKKNTFKLTEDLYGKEVSDKFDALQYPQ